MTCGIYSITHFETGRHYVGQSRNIERRWEDHLYCKVDTHISRAIRKHGKAAFKFAVLEVCVLSELDSRECFWIGSLQAMHPVGFNLRTGGGHGRMVSEVSRERMRQAALRNGSRPPAGRTGNPPSRLGKRHSLEAKERIGAALRGRKQSPEAVAARTAAIRAYFAAQ